LYFNIIKEGLSTDQKRMIADSGAWPILISLLNDERKEVAYLIGHVMKRLVQDRNGEDYAIFVEESLFGRMMKCLPSCFIAVLELLTAFTYRFPLPACCAPHFAAVNKQVQETKTSSPKSALNFLTSLALCRGMPSSFLSFT
jgi:hypothetical protein